MKNALVVTYLCLIFLQLSSCRKFVTVTGPVTTINADNIYNSDATAAAVLTAIYANMSNQNSTLPNSTVLSVCLYGGLLSDELSLYSTSDPNLQLYYTNNLNGLLSAGNFWASSYSVIFTVNSAIEGISKSQTLTPSIKKQLLGEAFFLRGFYYFYLCSFYGDVPLVTSSDYKLSSSLFRTPKSQVFSQIESDLIQAKAFLNSDFLKGDALSTYLPSSIAERVRPTKWLASSLLARLYLYNNNYAQAESESSLVINNNNQFSLDTITNVFNKNSKETIWSLQPINTGTRSNTGEGALFVLPASGPNSSTNPVYLSNALISSFENGDLRFKNWVSKVSIGLSNYYYPFKYKLGLVSSPTLEYPVIFRLAELYLIRAESRAQTGNNLGAIADLNLIRLRAGLNAISNGSKDYLLKQIKQERKIELFSEWGHRWLDLIRDENRDSLMNSILINKGGNWDAYKRFYPIPQSEIALDGNLKQNEGY